ncbi:hypothetical protein CC78DRAFT_587384 [Lojkania enalia]|uniref:Rhodopsin domain-containing protein n=1 Tax=Lojkania enalia TaxID=147567 RepID=A0A9P4N4F1_9PLEO|nr:hypothetical protein CC78DRAFT_587384 [Didymosphaeria enalia]
MNILSRPVAARAASITPNDKSAAIIFATAILLGIFVLAFLARETTKFVVLRKFQKDDLLIFLATIFAVGLSITTLILASNGLGILGTLTLRRANTIMKGYYASDFLYVLSICSAKLSLVAWFYDIGIQRMQRRIVQGFGIFIFAWTLASLIAVAFQCGLPKPWEVMTLHCYNSGAFWIVYCIIDMTTDVSIIMLSVNLVAYVKIKLARKVTVVACFAPRILVIAAALARLIYLFPITPHGNPEFNLWIPVICTQVQVCLSISTACIPYMGIFLKCVDIGLWRSDGYRRTLGGYAKTKGKEVYSLDSTAAGTSLKFSRTSDVSPRIPSPAPLSPITPLRWNTPPNTKPRTPSERGLRLHIPAPETRQAINNDNPSPQTASSHALSPECISPQPLLSPGTMRVKRQPSPPPRSHSPRPQAFVSPYGSPDPNNLSPQEVAPPVTIPKFPRPPSAQYSPFPPAYKKPPLPIPPAPTSRARSTSRDRRISNPRMQSNNAATRFPVRTSSLANQNQRQRQVKFSPTVKQHSASSSQDSTIPSYYTTLPTSQHTSTSTPSVIPSYYMTTPPMQPSAFPRSPPSHQVSSPQRQRNQRILTPQNSSRRDQISPVSPISPPTPLTFWRTDSSADSAGPSAGGAWGQQEASRNWPPIMRDSRSSPKIVLQRSD